MKYRLCILLLPFVFLFCACHSRKSPEDGEHFLQKMKTTGLSLNDTSLIRNYRQLVEAERLYHFTLPQQIRLKQLQLDRLHGYNIPQASRIADEMEALALRTGNDTLICNVRQQLFLLAKANGDTVRALRILRQQEQRVQRGASLYDDIGIGLYYQGIAVYYQKQGEWPQAVGWFRKARSYTTQPYTWYIQMAKSLLQAGEYTEALLYADSIRIATPDTATPENTPYSDIRGQALVRSGRIEEALDWYAQASREIEASHPKDGNHLYSLQQLHTLYHSALLHHQQGQTSRAIRQLEEIRLPAYPDRYITANETDSDRPLFISCYHLLSECYKAENRMQYATHYLQLIDSINRQTIDRGKTANAHYRNELRRNALISSSLVEQEEAVTRTRQTLYILYIVILLLLTIILTGIFAWQYHRRRLHRLFDILVKQHTLWLEEHTASPLPPAVRQPRLLPPPTIPVDRDKQHSLLYLRILHLMDTEKPYRDPSFDLITLTRLATTNRSQLSALLNQETPKGFSYWLAEYRVNDLIAQVELSPDKNIDELFPLAGFASRTTFYRQFRQVTGLTPKQYKVQRDSRMHPPVP